MVRVNVFFKNKQSDKYVWQQRYILPSTAERQKEKLFAKGFVEQNGNFFSKSGTMIRISEF